MYLGRLEADNFRRVERIRIEPQPRLNLFVGPNAAGKTSVLEMVYLLGRGRSFRASGPAELAGEAGRHWSVRGRVSGLQGADERVRLRWTPEESRLVTDSRLTLAELARRVPIQVVEPGQHRLLEDGPVYRRRFLDWGVFHVEHSFLDAWRAYQRALRQRNRSLKNGDMKAAFSFEPELLKHGERVHALRLAYLERLRSALDEPLRALLGDEPWSLDLLPGWKREQSLQEVLAANRERDRRQGQTGDGPHRAELKLRLGGASVRNRVSRGQQKLLVGALVLAQASLVHAATGCWPILLIDDFGAELGPAFREAWAARLRAYAGQVWVTMLESDPLLSPGDSGAMFHVEHGVVQQA